MAHLSFLINFKNYS